jgi:hypothetical protein
MIQRRQFLLALPLAIQSLRPATLPAELSDAEFWRMVTTFSEPGGYFQYENFVSNEVSYQEIVPELVRIAKPGRVYLGVAPEQNFTYIAAVQPKIAFIVDIRRQNMLELLMYKALFEMSPTRLEFASRLFSRRPAGVTSTASVEMLLRGIESTGGNAQLFSETLLGIKDRLKKHQFILTKEDEQGIDKVFTVFYQGGPRMDYGFKSPTPNNFVPNYTRLMTLTDPRGKQWSFLANDENYNRIRQMQQKNLIVPLVGNFTGPKTLKAVGRYAAEHGVLISAFYISNVEDYIRGAWASYVSNVAALPVDDSSVFIRFVPSAFTGLSSIPDFVRRGRR